MRLNSNNMESTLESLVHRKDRLHQYLMPLFKNLFVQEEFSMVFLWKHSSLCCLRCSHFPTTSMSSIWPPHIGLDLKQSKPQKLKQLFEVSKFEWMETTVQKGILQTWSKNLPHWILQLEPDLGPEWPTSLVFFLKTNNTLQHPKPDISTRGDLDCGVKANRWRSSLHFKACQTNYRNNMPFRSEGLIGLWRRQIKQKERISSRGFNAAATESSTFAWFKCFFVNFEEAQSSSTLRTLSGGGVPSTATTIFFFLPPVSSRRGRFFDLQADGCVSSLGRTPPKSENKSRQVVVDICSKQQTQVVQMKLWHSDFRFS